MVVCAYSSIVHKPAILPPTRLNIHSIRPWSPSDLIIANNLPIPGEMDGLVDHSRPGNRTRGPSDPWRKKSGGARPYPIGHADRQVTSAPGLTWGCPDPGTWEAKYGGTSLVRSKSILLRQTPPFAVVFRV